MVPTERIARVAIATKNGSREALRVAAELAEWLHRRKLTVLLERNALEAVEGDDFELFEDGSKCDLMIVLGGDGTLLSVARKLTGVPILGVNLGSLGFLTEVNRHELYPCLVDVLAGRFEIEERSLLAAELRQPGDQLAHFRALNEVVVTKSALARMIELRVEIDAHLVAQYRSDGLILSTPTGSTAYNLSAGGPIAGPTLPVVLVTPICPHTLSYRPLVVPESSSIEVKLVTGGEEVFLTLDGQEGTMLGAEDRIRVRAAGEKVLLVRVSGRSFYDNLRSKLRWGG